MLFFGKNILAYNVQKNMHDTPSFPLGFSHVYLVCNCFFFFAYHFSMFDYRVLEDISESVVSISTVNGTP